MSRVLDVNESLCCDNCFYSGSCRGLEACDSFRLDDDETDEEYILGLVDEGIVQYRCDWNKYIAEHQGHIMD